MVYFVNEFYIMFWFVDMLVCFNCGVFCFECRIEFGLEILEEMLIVKVIFDFYEMR